MQISINKISFNDYAKKSLFKAREPEFQKTSTNDLKLSNYEVSQAFINRNNISFRNLATPIEITDKYNKITEGKEHFDLPNIHVYEYPDTNLQVFIDENENMENSPLVEATLFINPQNTSGSIIKNELTKRLIARNLKNNAPEVELKNSDSAFYTFVTKSNINEQNYFKTLNNLIINPVFNPKDLEEEKQMLIKEINTTDYDKNIVYLLSDKKDFKSKEECIKEINKMTINDVKNYYKKTLKNSNGTYYLTLNKNLVDNNKLDGLMKELNDGLSVKFKNKTQNIKNSQFVLNNKNPLFIKDNSVSGIEFDYPYEEKTLRDYYIGLFTDFLLLFLAKPYYEDDSLNNSGKIPLTSNNDNMALKYHKLSFYMPKPDFTRLTPERALNLQKETAKMVYDTDFTVTLEDIKKVFKGVHAEDTKQVYQYGVNNEILYQNDCDIFNVYEIIDSINTSDIKQHMNRYILNQEPIIRYSENSQIKE